MKQMKGESSSFFSVTEKIHPADWHGELHTQDFFELTLVIGGRGVYEAVRGKRTEKIAAGPNTLLFWDGTVPHRSADVPGEPLHQLMLLFGYEYPAPFSLLPNLRARLRTDNPIVLQGLETAMHLKPLIRRVLAEYNGDRPGSADTVRALTVLLLTEIWRILQHAQREPSRPIDERIRQSIDYVARHYDQHFHLPEIARRCGLSARHFSELFKKATGTTFVRYVNQYRVSIAKEMLRSTDKKVITVAFETGFENLSLFNRTFKTFCGLTPNQYRQTRNADFGNVS